MQLELALAAALAGYLLGSISFARIVGRIVAPGADLTEAVPFPTTEQDRHLQLQAVSATTLGKRAGPRAGALAGILDVLKVLIPALVVRFVFRDQPYYLILALASMVGHIWPLYHRFHGGRGMSVAFGAFLAVDPIGTFAAWIVGTVLGVVVIRDAMTVFLGWTWLLVPWLWIRNDWRYGLFALGVNVLLFAALIPEIRAYMQYHREGIGLSFEQSMQTTDMGRGLYKMFARMGLLKDAPPAGGNES